MGDLIPFPRIRSASDGLRAALRELDEAMAELKAVCDERDMRLALQSAKAAFDAGVLAEMPDLTAADFIP